MKSILCKQFFACALLSTPLLLVAQQPPPAAPAAQQPTAPQATPQAAPQPVPTVPQVVSKERDAFSIGVFGWFGPGQLNLRKGTENTSTRAGDLDFHDNKRRPVEGAMVTVPIKEHYLRFSYFQATNSGNTTGGKDLNIFAGDYDKGTYLATKYKVQNGKISFDFLSWPFPFEGRKFRIRTLWEVQYTNIKSSVDAPLKPVGEGFTNSVESNKFLIWPTLGLGAEYRASKSFRLEVAGSGFAIPGRPNMWDAHGAAVMRLGKNLELSVGGKAFHFRMSKKTENFAIGTLSGAYVGMAWRFE